MTPIEHTALIEALDQYCANQREHEECEGIAPSLKLAAAESMLYDLNKSRAALADRAERQQQIAYLVGKL